MEDATIHTGYSPVTSTAPLSQLPASASKSGLFQGSSSEWAGDHVTYSQIERRPIAPRPDLKRGMSVPVSPSNFRNMPSCNEVQGLGLDLGEETPRLGMGGSWSAMMTPTLATPQQLPGLPGAPFLTGYERGRFPNVDPSSPIKPPLRNWNTDLRFEDRQFVPRPFAFRSFSDGPASAAMERERTVEIEGGLPMGQRTWGLAISTDDGRSFRRGDVYHRQDNSIIGSAPLRTSQLVGPPTPKTTASFNFSVASGSKASLVASPTMPSSASKRSHNHSTGLTPHIYKTRLTPSVSSSGKGKGAKSADGEEIGSPSLKMKSKQRSDQLREQAEFIASQGHLPSDLPALTSSSSPTSPTQDEDFDVIQEVHARTAPPSVSPRHKKVLGTRKVDHNAQRMDSSPWGVFGINTIHDAWQPLGPPALSKVLGKLELTDNHLQDNIDKSKKSRKVSPSISDAAFNKERSSSPTRKHRFGSEDKENDVFGSSTTVNKRTVFAPSPTKINTMAARKIVNIR